MNSILSLIPSDCVVIREGETVKVSATELVVGDLVRLSSGNKVPADIRIIRSSVRSFFSLFLYSSYSVLRFRLPLVQGDIKFDRSILTGESREIPGTVDK